MKTIRIGMGALLILLALLLLPFPRLTPVAHADAFQSVRRFFQLPQEVEKIQNNYRMLQQQADERYRQAQDEYKASYEKIQEQIEITQEDLDKAKATAEQFRMEQEKLIEQNEQLTEDNRKLAETVEGLNNTAKLKEKANKRLRTGLIAAVLLIAAAVFAGRFTRLLLRRRF
ncbi:MAG: hypothetical protein H7X86_05010 [Gorillibacterium sp.]|nr:hypothetical protein [Gorillibacterium sp.]